MNLMLDKHTVRVIHSSVIRKQERSRPCAMSFFRKESLIKAWTQYGPAISSGIGIVAGFTLLYYQNCVLSRCKEDLQNRLNTALTLLNQNEEGLGQQRDQFQSQIAERDDIINGLERAVSDQLIVAKKHTKLIVALALLAEGRRRRQRQILRSQKYFASIALSKIKDLNSEIDRQSTARQAMTVLANNRYKELADMQSPQPATPEASTSKLTLKEAAALKAPGYFYPPANWREISTTEIGMPITLFIEAYKRSVRSKYSNQRLPADRERAMQAETAYWLAKKAIPKTWLEVEMPEAVQTWVALKLAPKQGKPKSKGPTQAPSHTNGTTVHEHGKCPTDTVATLINLDYESDTGSVVAKPKDKGKGKAKDQLPAPPPLVPPPPVVSLKEIQERELELKGVCTVTVDDKVEKSKRSKSNKLTKIDDFDNDRGL